MLPTSPAARSRLAALALASALALSACSGDDRIGTASAPTADASATPSPSGSPATATPTTSATPGRTAGATPTPSATEPAAEPSSAAPSSAAPAEAPADTPAAESTPAIGGSPASEPAPEPAAEAPAPGAPAGEDQRRGGAAVIHPPEAGPEAHGLCYLPYLSLEAAPTQGAAGSVIATVTLTNDGDAPCTLDGYPGVSFVDAAGAMIGVPAERTPGAGGEALVLVPGQSATASLRISQADNHSQCDPRPAAGLRIYPPENTESVVVPFTTQACADPAVQQLEIQGFGA